MIKSIAAAVAIAVLPYWVPLPAWADTPNEDEPGWSCVDDGNRICGPGNPEGKPAGQYDEGGVLIHGWPL